MVVVLYTLGLRMNMFPQAKEKGDSMSVVPSQMQKRNKGRSRGDTATEKSVPIYRCHNHYTMQQDFLLKCFFLLLLFRNVAEKYTLCMSEFFQNLCDIHLPNF